MMGDQRTRDDARCNAALAALTKGDKGGLDVIYHTYGRMILSAAYQIVGTTEDAEDVLQDVLLRIGENPSRYTPDSNPRAWVMAITRNVALNLVKKRGRDLPLEKVASGEISRLSREGVEESAILQVALASLSEEERLIVNLKTYAGLSHKEIASVFGISEDSAQKRYQRAIEKLRKYFL